MERARTHGEVGGSRPPVSPEMVVGAVVVQCGVNRRNVKVEVCAPPFDFFVRFRLSEDCALASSMPPPATSSMARRSR